MLGGGAIDLILHLYLNRHQSWDVTVRTANRPKHRARCLAFASGIGYENYLLMQYG